MTLLEAITYLRTNLLDDVGGLGADWSYFDALDSSSLQLRWGNEELVSNINEALSQVYRRILPVKEMNSIFDITTITGVGTYPLDPRILQVVGVKSQSTGKTLTRTDIEAVWDDRSLFTEQKTPICYIPNLDSGNISFYAIPAEADTYSLLVYRLPLVPLKWSDRDLDIELREEFIVPMLDYAAALCYEKDEANTLDPNRTAYFMNKFDREFTVTSAYSDTRKRYTSNRAIKYGGY